MKKVKILLVLIAAAVVLFGIYYALGKSAEKQEAEQAQQSEESTDTVLYSSENLASIDYTYQGEQIHFVKIGEYWHHNDIAGFSTNNDLLSNMELMAMNITGRPVDGGSELFGQVGLGEPQLRIIFTDKSNVGKTLCFGMKNQVTGEYYACIEGETDVYMVAGTTVEAFLYTTEELRAEEPAA